MLVSASLQPHSSGVWKVLAVSGVALHLLVLVASTRAQPVPQWPAEFYQEFNETTKVIGTPGTTVGRQWYSASLQAERIERDNGHFDRYCGSVQSKDTPCTHYVVNGQRWLDFPAEKYCCSCCDAAKGCGIVKQSWLDGAVYVGTSVYQGETCYEWNQKGLQSNYYYATADGVPCRLDQDPNDDQVFNIASFAKGPFAPSVFELPSYCKDRCPLFSICTVA